MLRFSNQHTVLEPRLDESYCQDEQFPTAAAGYDDGPAYATGHTPSADLTDEAAQLLSK